MSKIRLTSLSTERAPASKKVPAVTRLSTTPCCNPWRAVGTVPKTSVAPAVKADSPAPSADIQSPSMAWNAVSPRVSASDAAPRPCKPGTTNASALSAIFPTWNIALKGLSFHDSKIAFPTDLTVSQAREKKPRFFRLMPVSSPRSSKDQVNLYFPIFSLLLPGWPHRKATMVNSGFFRTAESPRSRSRPRPSTARIFGPTIATSWRSVSAGAPVTATVRNAARTSMRRCRCSGPLPAWRR